MFCHITHINTKKAGICLQCSAFVPTQKKRDCTVAVPLLEAFALPNHIEQQREAHADMYAQIHTLKVRLEIDIHIPRTSIVAKF